MTKRGDRFEAIEALKVSVKGQFGMLGNRAASKGYVEEPETNGVVERFHRTFKEQIIHGRVYKDVANLQEAVREFALLYNEQWLLEKLGYKSLQAARARLESESYAA